MNFCLRYDALSRRTSATGLRSRCCWFLRVYRYPLRRRRSTHGARFPLTADDLHPDATLPFQCTIGVIPCVRCKPSFRVGRRAFPAPHAVKVRFLPTVVLHADPMSDPVPRIRSRHPFPPVLPHLLSHHVPSPRDFIVRAPFPSPSASPFSLPCCTLTLRFSLSARIDRVAPPSFPAYALSSVAGPR